MQLGRPIATPPAEMLVKLPLVGLESICSEMTFDAIQTVHMLAAWYVELQRLLMNTVLYPRNLAVMTTL